MTESMPTTRTRHVPATNDAAEIAELKLLVLSGTTDEAAEALRRLRELGVDPTKHPVRA
jgi:hypothetical protein